MAAGEPRRTRRTSDHILIAFHHACDQKEFELAGQLLTVLELVLSPRGLPLGAADRRVQETLVAAYERLWQLRHPDPVEC